MKNKNEMTTQNSLAVIVLGLITAIYGIFNLIIVRAPFPVPLANLFIGGVFAIVASMVYLFQTFQATSMSSRLLRLWLSVLLLVCGIDMVMNPIFYVLEPSGDDVHIVISSFGSAIPILLATYCISDGLLELIAGYRLRPKSGFIWLLLVGMLSILIGIMIGLQYPFSYDAFENLTQIKHISSYFGLKIFLVGIIMMRVGIVS